MNVSKALTEARSSLAKITDSPNLDTEWLMLEVLGQNNAAYLLAHDNDELAHDQQDQFKNMVRRRATGEPLAYILGHWEFYGRRFVVNRDVLVPRPSTEELVDTAIRSINKLYKRVGRPLHIADAGTGSGCVAVTLALEVPDKIERLYGIDISPAALKIAKENAKKHGVADRIEFLPRDMLEYFDLPQSKLPKVDLVVSNPPYVPSKELAEKSELSFEPVVALDGGVNGLRFIRHLIKAKMPVVYEGIGGDIHVV